MRSTSFRTAQRRVLRQIRQHGAGVLMVALALSASAKDGSPSGNLDASIAKAEAKAGAKAGTQTATKTGTKTGTKARTWLQVGVASWYGSQFQGRRTAGGEPFDMNEMTCAHPTLPMGTWLRVTNLTNRRTAFVRVNDRGPVLEGRIVDLSLAAARALGMGGMAKVSLERVREGDAELARALIAQLQVPAAIGTPVSTDQPR